MSNYTLKLFQVFGFLIAK